MLVRMILSETDRRILQTIRDIRAVHHACTAGAVASQLRLSRTYVIQRCEIMRAVSLVNWTRMVGSLHCTDVYQSDVTDESVKKVVKRGRPSGTKTTPVTTMDDARESADSHSS